MGLTKLISDLLLVETSILLIYSYISSVGTECFNKFIMTIALITLVLSWIFRKLR